MKKLTTLFCLIFFLGLSKFGSTQTPVTTINTSGLNECNGIAYVSDSLQFQSWNWFFSDSLIQSNGMLTGLCPGTYSIELIQNGISSTYFFDISFDTLGPCSSFYAYINSTNVSSSGACDGSAIAIVQGGTEPYIYQWDNGQTGSSLYNLCEGLYTLSVVDANGCAFTSTTYLSADSSNWNYDLSAYVYTYSPSMTGLCDGSAYVDVYGGVEPYTFEHSNGDMTQFPSNLCAGIYSVIVTDANGDQQTLNYIVPEYEDIYFGGNYDDSTIIDTLNFGLIEDCLIEYNSLDTAFISNIEYIGQDSILVTWSVIDGNGTTTFLQSYTISTGIGVYDLILQIFCPQRSGNEYVYAYDQIYFNPAFAKINELIITNLNAYPNPFENVLKINLNNALATQITITDISGKVMFNNTFSNSEIEINTENFSKGQYFVNISNKEINSTLKVVK